MIIDTIATRSGRRAALLDIDGTLVDTNGAHAASWSAASGEFGYARDAAFFRPLMGMGGDHVLPEIDPALSDDTSPGKEIARRRGEIFKERFLPHVRATPGARALIERLKADGWLCVMATSAKPDELQPLLEIVGIAEAIDEAAHSEDAETSKPAPDIVSAALRKANVDPQNAFLLGDSRYDLEAAARAGVATIGLRCGGSTDAELAGAAERYDDPQALLVALDAAPSRE